MRLLAGSWPVVLCGSAGGVLIAGGALLASGASLAAQAGAEERHELPASRCRVECFELRASPTGPALGFASLRRMDSAAGTDLEWQVHFPADELNIWHVESRDAQNERWIWREGQPRHSRSVIADRVGAALEVTEWGRPSVWRALLVAPQRASFPLELEEGLRDGTVDANEVALFDPLSNEIETVRVVREGSNVPEDGPRRVDLVRADGSLAGSWTFLAGELVGFRWQRGGLIAVRVDEASYPMRGTASSSEGTAAAVPAAR